MKYIILLLLFLFFQIPQASAHGPGQQPYFKINDKYTLLYPVFLSSNEHIVLPQDIAPEAYLPGEQLTFSFDTKTIPIPEEVLDEVDLQWDFGDGTKASGLSNTHAFSNIGSYMVTIHVVYTGTGDETPQLLQSTLVHIVPAKAYKLPVANLRIDGKTITDPLVDTVTISFKKEITFDASRSTASTNFVEYTWDFGDGKTEKTSDPKIYHFYDVASFEYGLPMVFPLLRIRTEDGFIADTFAQINNKDVAQPTSIPDVRQQRGNIVGYFMIAIGVVIVGSVLFYFIKKILK